MAGCPILLWGACFFVFIKKYPIDYAFRGGRSLGRLFLKCIFGIGKFATGMRVCYNKTRKRTGIRKGFAGIYL